MGLGIHPWLQTLKSTVTHAFCVAVGDIVHLRARVAALMVDELVRSGGRLATPDDPLAKLRRLVLRGLRTGERRNGFP